MDRLSQEQSRRNVEADTAWALYEPHRVRVTRLLLAARSPSAKRLCLLGAGNLNDFDLVVLMSAFSELVVVDVDAESLQRGLTRQGFACDERIQLVAPADVTGIFTDLSLMLPDQPVSDVLVERCLAAIQHPPRMSEIGPCDVVASVGLLTQLIESVVKSIGESHPRFWEVVAAVRLQHLLLLLELTQADGNAVLVTEVVSSDSCIALRSVNESDLKSLLTKEISARNFFTGTNPAALHQLLQTEPRLASQLTRIEFSSPWLWQFIARIYAVYGVLLWKNGSNVARL
ncbi:MAG: hypothetical protein NT013_23930 [Planctomycetia bacterium]|nr:hypothetical protein [Planctomycetia bacterium]